MYFFKKKLDKKNLISTFEVFKEMKIKKSDFIDFIDIIEINIFIYYYLTRNKENKLFFLIINEIYNKFAESPDITLQIKKNIRISINKS